MFFDNSSNLNSSLSASQSAKLKTTPITGFGGHIPGDKWRIGSNIRSPEDLPNPKGPNATLAPLNNSKRPGSRRASARQGGRGYAEPFKNSSSQHSVVFSGEQGHQIEDAGHGVVRRAASAPRNGQRSRPESRQQRPGSGQHHGQSDSNEQYEYEQYMRQQQQLQQQYQQQQQQLQQHYQQEQQEHHQQHQQHEQQQQQQQQQHQPQQGQQNPQQQQQQRNRSNSVQPDGRVINNHQPKSVFMGDDIFAGLEKGWWSQGEVERNKQRREQALRGQVPGRQSQVYKQQNGGFGGDVSGGSGGGGGGGSGAYVDGDKDRVPAPGYSGHMPGLREHDFGKPWTVAAKESREHYLLQQKENMQKQEQAQVH